MTLANKKNEKKVMPLNEKAIRFLEEQIPEMADSAVKQAYWRTLAAGYNVLESENNAIVEVHPDGSRKIIKKLAPCIPVFKGQRLEIQ